MRKREPQKCDAALKLQPKLRSCITACPQEPQVPGSSCAEIRVHDNPTLMRYLVRYMRKETMRAAATTDDAAGPNTDDVTAQNAYTLYSDSTQALVLYVNEPVCERVMRDSQY